MTSAMQSRMFKQGYEYAKEENEILILGYGFGPDPRSEPFDDPANLHAAHVLLWPWNHPPFF